MRIRQDLVSAQFVTAIRHCNDRTALDDDQDTNPQGNGVVGDGLINYEEYRGFLVRGQHRRTNPYQKDLFIDSTLSTDIGYANNLPVTKHWVFQEELSTDVNPLSVETYLVNSYYANSGYGGTLGSHANQRGIRVRPAAIKFDSYYGKTPPGCSPSCTPNYMPPAGEPVAPALIFLGAIRADSPISSDPAEPEYPDSAAIMKTTGHEVGHMISMEHYVYTGAGGRITVMISGFFPWANSDWSNIPALYDSEDLIRLQVR